MDIYFWIVYLMLGFFFAVGITTFSLGRVGGKLEEEDIVFATFTGLIIGIVWPIAFPFILVAIPGLYLHYRLKSDK